MKGGSLLLFFASLFGIGVFAALFFFAPSPFSIHLPFIQKAFLPASGIRVMSEPEPSTSSLVFTGDIMLARSVEQAIAEKGSTWPFMNLGDLFSEADLVVGNFEGTVRQTPRYEVVNEMTFDTTPSNVALVKEAGFTHLSIANNHADDFGAKVTEDTREAIRSAGMIPFGDPYASGDFVAREIVNGLRISLVGYHAFGDDLDDVVDAVKNEKAIGQFVIVMPHWGTEYEITPSVAEVDTAQKLVQAGADLIIGSHPHVVQSIEVVDGVPVLYSLGNFLFDQDFSAETMQGLTARVIISDSDIDISLTPVAIVDRQTTPQTTEDSATLFSRLGLPTGHLAVPRLTSSSTQ